VVTGSGEEGGDGGSLGACGAVDDVGHGSH